jgi:peroxiredoxin
MKFRKHVITFALAAVMLTAVPTGCNQGGGNGAGKEYVISVKTRELAGSYLFLAKRADGSMLKIDSLLIPEAGVVSFKGKLSFPEMLFLFTGKDNKPVAFFAENSVIEVEPDFIAPEKTLVKGSAAQTELDSFTAMFANLNLEAEKAYEQYTEARQTDNKTLAEAAVSRLDSLEQLEVSMSKEYVMKHPASVVAPYLIRTKLSYSLTLNELKELVSLLAEDLNNSVYTIELKNRIAVLEKVEVGQKFTDFRLPAADGGEFSLSEIAGKSYLLIDFWAAWCGPCRRANPGVVALYNEFHAKGFNILGVSFDTDEARWKQAIADDGLTWKQVSDLKGWASAAGKLYGVNSIPHTVLLDPQGVIIAKNLKEEELRAKLSEVLK